MSNEKKEIYLEALVRGILSKSENLGENKAGKKSFFSFSRILLTIFFSTIVITFIFRPKDVLGTKGFFSTLFPNYREVEYEKINTTFKDVKGSDEAKTELVEIVNYLREPEKYLKLGAKLPKGVILVGPPGTGKTLLARAVAGEANVPFFYTSGSEFDEILVGEGAKRVRALFKNAKANAPCIIFIDEIDSIGSTRVLSSIHPYANQTINQLLTEMDGFNKNEGIIVIAATNRFDDLDKALLRPGRFDIHVFCKKPDLAGRKEMFDLYLSKITHKGVDVEKLARSTMSFTGADIENLVNQAALKAATEGYNFVMQKHLEDAKDRVLMGPARIKGKVPNEKVNKYTAYHEAGHTLVAIFTSYAKPLNKVTIIPRGNSLGHASFIPKEELYQTTKAELLAELDVCMGGRVAEELIFGSENITTGAHNDLKRATEIAKALVQQFGMSENIGLRDYTNLNNKEILSQHMSEKIDQEIDRIMKESYERAKKILTTRQTEHKRLAEALLEYETLTLEEVERVIEGIPLTRKPTEIFSDKEYEKKKIAKSLDTSPVVAEGSGNFV